MRRTVMWLGLAIVATAVGALMLFGGSGSVAGMEPAAFARLARLVVILMMVSAVFVGFRRRLTPRLWHVAVWLGLLVALMAGWQAAHGGF